MTERQWNVARKRIWRDPDGCDCPNFIVEPDGRRVRLKADERCTPNAIRCNGRLAVVQAKLAELGPNPKERSHDAA